MFWAAPFFDLKNSECYSYIRLNGCFYIDLCEICDIRQTPCWTRGIKIIITLEIGHGGGCTLVIFRGHMPVPAGTKPGEREKKRRTIAYLIWHCESGLGRLTLFNRGYVSLWSRISKEDECEGSRNRVILGARVAKSAFSMIRWRW